MIKDQLMYQPSSQTSVSMLIQAGLILLLWRGLQLGFFVISGWVSNMPSSSSIISDDDSDIELFFKCWPVNQTRQSSTTFFIRHLSFRKPFNRETRIPVTNACFLDNPPKSEYLESFTRSSFFFRTINFPLIVQHPPSDVRKSWLIKEDVKNWPSSELESKPIKVTVNYLLSGI